MPVVEDRLENKTRMDATNVESPSDEKNRSLIKISDFDFFYGDKQALFDINMDIAEKEVTAFIGPSGCGKSTLLRCINRMNDLIDIARIGRGDVRVNGVDIYDSRVDATELRKRVGMVFQKSNPFPKSIYENVVYGLKDPRDQQEIGFGRCRGEVSERSRSLGRSE